MRVASILLGALLYGLALPPWDQAWCGWLVLLPVLLAIRGTTSATAFRYGLLFGYASGWAVLWTLAETAAAYLDVPVGLGVAGVSMWFLGVVGLPFALFAAGVAKITAGTIGPAVPLATGALWVAAELLRGRVLGQPWALLGYSQHDETALIQVAAATGVYGVSFLLATTSAGLAESIIQLWHRRGLRQIAIPIALPVCLVGAAWLAGTTVLGRTTPAVRGRPVAIIQTNVIPPLRWSPSYSATQVRAHVVATARLSPSLRPALIVWPEYAVPRYVAADPGLGAVLSATARRHHADLLFGAPRADGDQRYNSAEFFHSDGRTSGHYDKRRLVAFAETNPLGRDDEAFAPGASGSVLPGFVPLGVSICHEILHPDLIAASVRDGARVLVNVANDSWLARLSDGAGRQHLAMATLRAVETRRYLVRAAITGASAVFDPFGRVVAILPPGRPGVLAAWVAPEAATTWYVRMGDVFAIVCTAVALAALLLALRRPSVAVAGGGSLDD